MRGLNAGRAAAGAAAIFALLLGGSLAAAGTAAAAPARSTLQAYLLSSAPDSLRDLKAHAGSIGVLYPTYFQCADPSGRVGGVDDPAVTGYAHARGIPVMPRFSCQQGELVHLILAEPRLRAATLQRLVAIARDPLYRGLNLDLENDGSGDRAALTSFVSALAQRLHALGKRLTVVVDGVSEDDPASSTGFYDDRALAALADSVFVLAWGAHWQGSAPGPIAPPGAAAATASYLASLPDASRFVLGAPMYGIDWADGGGPAHEGIAYQYTGIIALEHKLGVVPHRDPGSGELTFNYTDAAGLPHQVWYMDSIAVRRLLQIARQHGLKAGLWRLGEEDPAIWPGASAASG